MCIRDSHYIIGKGGFGKVWKVEIKKTRAIYAMKEMSKAKILSKKSVSSVINEKQLLSSLRHPFIVNMTYAFQDRDNVYLVMDLMTGGDLRFHLCKQRRFNEQQTKFFVACMIAGLEYLHSNGVLHRDIKPENLVFDPEGYLRITDLGIARVWRPDNANDTSGTPGYMAPEVMCRQNHGVAVDYYAVGVIAFECMIGKRPYLGRSRKDIRDQILARQVQLKKIDIPEGWSTEAADFINRMIQRKPANRLGANGPDEVKAHPWFEGFSWDKLLSKQMPPSFIPKQGEENFDLKYAMSADPWLEENAELLQQNMMMLRRNSVQALFDDYHFDPNSPVSPASGLSYNSTASKTIQPAKVDRKSSLSSYQVNTNNSFSESPSKF
eukprot:TRINITY_DN670_c0_g1_i2.p1 TRINITY_DN670_c0_g1~~TRINITY_DN670_c0_g1_i2.p1  ORF type:complete len:380 (-),score=79.38 TRINITY_DN670_c0_g1_i2:31-1170(-)